MIVLRLEMWPGGDPKRSYELGRTYVINDAKKTNDDPKKGDYLAIVCRRGNYDLGDNMRGGATRLGKAEGEVFEPLAHGTVENYPRLSYNVWRLIIRALKSAFPEEK